MSEHALPLPTSATRWRRPLPGLGLGLGIGMTWLGLIVLLPLAALILRSGGLGMAGWVRTVSDPLVLSALRVSFLSAFIAAVTALVFGALIAWVLVRYRFPGRRLMDALVDLPFALPTAVAGITLAAIYDETGWIGQLLQPFGIKLVNNLTGIVIALIFIGLPFAVRTVQPVLEALGREQEEAAISLGASRLTALRRVVLPELLPALLTGFSLAFARGLGEYGSVIFIAGNLPMKTQIAPLLITIRLFEDEGINAAIVLATLLLLMSFACLVAINAASAFFSHGNRRDG
ncbi:MULTISPECIES: sulfate ABC transporter permease subunit CysT [unclassified Lysobacter]|uniref:sulfate ABC transporter permease subunit CysT n=1 Tax=unclassified Lysobacter TaxID=2635362 RepID=UPI001BE81CDE|nr:MULTISPECIES: sulfate ABC transporter permease subunit CysT [unclassified Lysobacter]MBT2748995.1 sulfate ABC transporter permease subunit CysT [Lysobacter sp. ISL-42]MBT2750328.1 sulfate ABC transporter permease subunit CysT [Lysobacter sp. ISL-50]MBT2778426.1 sulfate ABC transporter permease subunit CysT [Lysobacter sp. ISL-54]MBT2781042.1 sulfate ABC transporter permease subunit CysT [Lysobacter sp. ISL-52]